MRKLLREPLLHFLAVGLGLFVLYEFVAVDGGEYNRKVIDVNQDTLLTFIQYRSQSFDPEIATARFENMPAADLELLIADFVKEEALHREAVALGMDKNDYIIKRRMIQSIEFITAGFATAGVELSDADIATYYEANRDNYVVAPYVTFTHIFFSGENNGRDTALDMAKAKRTELNEMSVPFGDAPRHGDRFPYGLNYVEREPGFIAGNFGPQMAEAIFELETDDSTWQGPLESPY
ncbi:MAG: peptidyl-prolyl cis-trans isomerase, partial [Woeseiaceae bacterium]